MKKTMTEFTEYKGHKLLVLNPDDKFPFKFGKKKAQLIVEHFDAIKAFAEEEDDGDSTDND